MDQQGFARFLSKKGKKPHVVAGLIAEVERFEGFLSAQGGGLDGATADGLHAYVRSLDGAAPGRAAVQVRGIALYYAFAGNAALASLASSIREEGIAKGRTAYKLKGFRGAGKDDLRRLAAVGISDVDQMREEGKTPALRAVLAARTGVSAEAILDLVKLSDLARLEGVRGIRARLYLDSGVDTPAKIAAWEPEALRQMLSDYVARAGFDGIAPLPKEVRNHVATARGLPPVVEY